MSAEELGEMTEEEKKDEKAIKEMIDKEHNSINKDGKKEDYEKEIKKLEDVCSNT